MPNPLRRIRSQALLLAALLTLAAIAARPQTAADPDGPRRNFSIGFLPEGADIINAPVAMDRLRQALLARPAVAAALLEGGYSAEIELSACGGPRDMIQRMNLSEFDLAFATAVVYARQEGGYGAPILMTWLPGDFKQQRDGGVLRRGVVIAGRASTLFGEDDATTGVRRTALAAGAMAVPAADSAAGYVYPALTLYEEFGLAGPGRYLFCGSEDEAIKNVVAGAVPFGACRRGAIELLLPGAALDRYCKVVMETDQFPTDPVLLRDELMPERSALGRELKIALRDFFQTQATAQRGLTLENSDARAYENVRRALTLFDRLGARPAAPADGPRPAVPAPSPTAPPAPSPAMPEMLGSAP